MQDMTQLEVETRLAGANSDYGSGVFTAKAILLAMTQLGGLQVILALTGLVRNKVAAVYLNTSGMGEWSQVQGVATLVFTVVQFGMVVGLSRNVAAAKSQIERQRQFAVANTLTITVVFVAVVAALALYFRPGGHQFLSNLGISPRLQPVLLLFIVLLAPFEALRNNFLSVLQGVLDIRGMASKRAIAVVLATLAAIPLIAMLGIPGACLQFALASILLAVLLGYRCHQLGYRPLRFEWDKRAGITLASLGAAALLAGFAYSWADVLIRAELIRYASLSEAGIYQAAFLLSSQVTQIALGSIGVFSLASTSKSTLPQVISAQLHLMYRVILPICTLGLGLLGLLEVPVIQLLFSAQFKSSSAYLPLLLIGNSAQAACWVAGAPLLGGGRVGIWLTLELGGACLRYFAAILLLPVIGTQAIPLAFLLGQAFSLSSALLFCSRSMKIRTPGTVLGKIGISVALPGVLAWIGQHPSPVTFGIGVIVLSAGAFALAPAQSSRCAARAVQVAARCWLPRSTPS